MCPKPERFFSFLGQGKSSSASFADGSPPLEGYSEKVDSGIFSTSDKVDYKKLCLSKGEIKDLRWWTQGPARANGRVFIPPEVVSLIFSDDSKIRWGTHLVEISIEGCWNKLEAPDQTNHLELEAAFLALRVFLPLIKGSLVQCGLDNCAAVAYIIPLGGTGSQLLTALALNIWHYAPDRNMMISAIHVPGKWNHIAEGESRVFRDSIELMIDHYRFNRLPNIWDSQLWICLPLR